MHRRKSDEGAGGDCKVNNDQSNSNNGDAEAEESTSALLLEARKRTKLTGKVGEISCSIRSGNNNNQMKAPVMHQYKTSGTDIRKRNADLVTSTVEVHPGQQQQNTSGTASVGEDGIFRDKTRSKLLAGPIKVTASIRTTARFDYQPDVCKDYKETGFCGYGDTCIYLHDRGDTLSGWQLEQQWEAQQKAKKEQQEREIQGFVDGSNNKNANNSVNDENVAALLAADDGLPFACFICRRFFTNPIVTSCSHYFCAQVCPSVGREEYRFQ